MVEYRVRFHTGRVIGPLNLNDLIRLKELGEIPNLKEYQEFPAGDWRPFSEISCYQEIINTDFKLPLTDETFVMNMALLEDLPDDNIPKPHDDIGHTVVMPSEKSSQELKSQELETKSTQKTDDPDKTKINPKAQAEILKIRKEQERLEKEKQQEIKKQLEQKQRADEEKKKKDNIRFEKTEMYDANAIKEELAKASENELEIEENEHAKKIRESLPAKPKVFQKEVLKKNSSRQKIVVTLIVLAVVYLFTMEDEGSKSDFVPQTPVIEFPIPFSEANRNIAEEKFNSGLKLIASENYPRKLKASKYFKEAYENEMKREYLGWLYRSYATTLANSINKNEDALTLFKLYQAKQPNLLEDPNGVVGVAEFFRYNKKIAAAKLVLEKYLSLFQRSNLENSPLDKINLTHDVFALYLKVLTESGNFDEAKKIFNRLNKEKETIESLYALVMIYDYLYLVEESDRAKGYIDQALKLYPKSVWANLKLSSYYLRTNELGLLYKTLKVVEDQNYESNHLYFGEYLKYLGFLLASKNEVEKATKAFTASLKIQEDEDLRTKLSMLVKNKITGNEIIDQSKSLVSLREAKLAFSQKKYDLALSKGLIAADATGGVILSEIFLAKIELKMGHANQAVNRLKKLKEQHGSHLDVLYGLIDIYIETYKFNQAKNAISTLPEEEKNLARYASINAKLFLKMNDSLQAILWLRESIGRNPLNDSDIYQMAELLIKRAKFSDAQNLLSKAIELDPTQIDYRLSYSRLIYETQGDNAAIGYLMGLKKDFPSDPKLLSEIAILYYRVGRVKDFLSVKKELEENYRQDALLYDFLIKSALIDERFEEIPGLVEQLLKLEPGDMSSMMIAAKVLFETGKYQESAKWFLRIEKMLDSFPKVKYYKAKIKLLAGDLDSALAEVQTDITENGEGDEILVLLAEIYMAKGEKTEAENNFKKAQKYNPRSYKALVGLAELSAQKNNFDNALDLFKKALALNSIDPDLHKKIGDVYRRLGQGSLAIESYKMYLDMAPDATDKNQVEAYINLMQ